MRYVVTLLVLAVSCIVCGGPTWAAVVAYYPFDGNPLDHSTNTNHATLQNGAGYATGLVGQALSLDGNNQYATVADHPSLRIGPYTVSAWVRPQVDNEFWTGVVGKPGRNFNMWMGNSDNQHNTGGGYIHHRFRDGGNWNAAGGDTPSGSVPFGAWTHVVITNDGERALTYLNGQKVVHGTLSNLGINNTTLYMGRSLDGNNSGYYRGLIDDVALWGEPLTPAQIKAVTAGTSPLTVTEQVTQKSPHLVAHWRFDETTGTTISDSSGNGYDGGIVGSGNWVAGKRGGALQFTGGSGDRVMLDHPVDLEAEWTISAWFNDLDPSGAWRTLTRGMRNDHQIIVENTSQILGTYDNANGGFRSSGFDISGADDGFWHHIAAVGLGGQTNFFIDGQYVGTSDRQSVNDVWSLGNHTGGGQRFARYIDDLAIFDIALTGQQIRGLAAGGDPTLLIPEPTTMLIWSLLAGLGVGLRWRRRK